MFNRSTKNILSRSAYVNPNRNILPLRTLHSSSPRRNPAQFIAFLAGSLVMANAIIPIGVGALGIFSAGYAIGYQRGKYKERKKHDQNNTDSLVLQTKGPNV